MVWEDLTPDQILTPAAFDNAIKVHMAMGGSTNAIIHVVAMARRAGIPLDMERFDELSREVPVLANVRPSGKYLMEDFFYAGGLRGDDAGACASKLDLSCLTVTGKTIGENIEGAQVHIPRRDPLALTIRSIGEGATAVLKGNLAPQRLRDEAGRRRPALPQASRQGDRVRGLQPHDARDRARRSRRHARPHSGAQERRAEGRARHAGMGHAADPEAAAGAGRARHGAHFRRRA